ncbi:insulinase family protein [Actinoplanes oblitus]|uniref:Insulinase family protein n=1 Tax=Actinoplanes oblitus TaxID=3040509 RepID=A0ABY8WKD7_9ACTN|nr:insulinase family protein [Actinoplanes oblitus]WIM98349.1 insulinase family protein [Actinoplanes oblitus]
MIEQLTVDRVPVLFTRTAGPIRAGLVFRVGVADETAAQRGVTRLVERLVRQRARCDAETGTEYVSFHASGSTDFLAEVCAALRDLPVAGLAAETAAMRSEAAGQPAPLTGAMPLWRYGARGHGLPALPEWGLGTLTADHLRSWASTRFTRQNAVLWIAGDEVPAGLRLNLPDGARWPAPVPWAGLPVTPAWFAGGADGLAWDTVVPDDATGRILTELLERRLERDLAARPQVAYQARADGTALLTVAASTGGPGDALLGGFLDGLAGLRFGHLTADDVAAAATAWSERVRAGEGDGSWVAGQARRVLAGLPVVQAGDAVAAGQAVGTGDVAAGFARALAGGLLMTPAGSDAGWASYALAPASSAVVVDGAELTMPGRPGHRLVLGESGVSMVDQGTVLTVRFADCVALLRWPDGGRRVVGADGISVDVEPALYPAGESAVAWVDSRVPGGTHVPLPARDAADIPRPPARPAAAEVLRARAGRILRRLRDLRKPAVLAGVGLLLGSIAARGNGGLLFALPGAFCLVYGYLLLRQELRK